MKTAISEPDDDLRPEYDFHSLQVVARGPGRRHKTIELAPDLADAFPDSAAVNEALRLLLKLAKTQVAA